jgi:hypothetical protein
MRLCVALSILLVGAAVDAIAQYQPPNGFVPDEATAIKIAVAIWSPIYGKAEIERERPYRARLKEGVWIVESTLPKGLHGGDAHVEISKKDGKILLVYKGK